MTKGMNYQTTWASTLMLLMSCSAALYCFAIMTSLQGREAVPMSTQTHILMISWCMVSVVGGLVLLTTDKHLLPKVLCAFSTVVAIGSLIVWLGLIFLDKLRPYAEIHNV